MPVRNAAHTLPEALDSLRRQSCTDHEVLVFDDGSTDDSANITSRRGDMDSRIRLIGSERVGLVEALRRIVESSDAELLARMDADDISHPERLEEQLALIDRRPELVAVGCRVRCFPEKEVKSGMRLYERWLNELCTPEQIDRDIFVESPLCHPTVLMQREAYERVGGYRDNGLPEDYDLWLRFFGRGWPMAKVQRRLFHWRESGGRLTHTDERYATQRFLKLKIEHLLRGPLCAREAVSIWGAGRTGRKWSRALADVGVKTASFFDVHRKKLGKRVYGVPVLPPPSRRAEIPAGFILAAVGVPGARYWIRRFLWGLGLEDMRDFIAVA